MTVRDVVLSLAVVAAVAAGLAGSLSLSVVLLAFGLAVVGFALYFDDQQ